jgi:hypothetical protein
MSLALFVVFATCFSTLLLVGLLAMASLFTGARHPHARFSTALEELDEYEIREEAPEALRLAE